MTMNDNQIKEIVKQVLAKMDASQQDCASSDFIVEASARHVHLTIQDVELLFGKGQRLTKKRDLSQPGEFLSEQRVKLVTAKGELVNVAVLGPERKQTQVELSMTDSRTLGLKPPVNLSGNLENAADVLIFGTEGFIEAKNSVIIAHNHIHMTPSDAEKFEVVDGDHVKVCIHTQRPVTFDDVVVRINPNFSLTMHIDFDEANACCLGSDDRGKIVGKV